MCTDWTCALAMSYLNLKHNAKNITQNFYQKNHQRYNSNSYNIVIFLPKKTNDITATVTLAGVFVAAQNQ